MHERHKNKNNGNGAKKINFNIEILSKKSKTLIKRDLIVKTKKNDEQTGNFTPIDKAIKSPLKR